MTYDSTNGLVILFGGLGRHPNELLHDTWAWDGSKWRELTTSVAPDASGGGSMTYDPASRRAVLYEFAGGSPADRYMWFFDTQSWTRRPAGTTELPLGGFSMVYDDAIHKVVLFGGGGGFAPPPSLNVRNDTWTWDGRGWTRRTPPTAPPGRVEASMAYDAERKEVVLFGGLTDTNQVQVPLNDTWTWDGTIWTRRAWGG